MCGMVVGMWCSRGSLLFLLGHIPALDSRRLVVATDASHRIPPSLDIFLGASLLEFSFHRSQGIPSESFLPSYVYVPPTIHSSMILFSALPSSMRPATYLFSEKSAKRGGRVVMDPA